MHIKIGEPYQFMLEIITSIRGNKKESTERTEIINHLHSIRNLV